VKGCIKGHNRGREGGLEGGKKGGREEVHRQHGTQINAFPKGGFEEGGRKEWREGGREEGGKGGGLPVAGLLLAGNEFHGSQIDTFANGGDELHIRQRVQGNNFLVLGARMEEGREGRREGGRVDGSGEISLFMSSSPSLMK